jgi:hypothetical protein
LGRGAKLALWDNSEREFLQFARDCHNDATDGACGHLIAAREQHVNSG